MTKYDVYRYPVRGYAAIKRGFSWPGFFFGIFWALAKRLWKVVGLLVLTIFVSAIFFQLLTKFGHSIDHFLLSNLIISLVLLVVLSHQ
jgi:hypothetical protein